MAERNRQGSSKGAKGAESGEAAVLLKAISHPIRARALTVLNQRAASPSELAAEQDAAVPDVAYHVRVLRELGMIKLVSTRQVRGATQHFYRSVDQPYLDEDVWRQLLGTCG